MSVNLPRKNIFPFVSFFSFHFFLSCISFHYKLFIYADGKLLLQRFKGIKKAKERHRRQTKHVFSIRVNWNSEKFNILTEHCVFHGK